uniref:Photosystem I reaction center subunit XII n=2 Tax=Gracilaria TaxID=2774 RepID=A0A1P8D6N7_9FLOR|nr:photosystem I reaction center subunit XII [Gracilaria firma]YP_009497896.1 PsaM [Gracilaria changii]YP_009510371.1 photosystem I reaction center subunit M [Gracilaria caudata]YP_010195675.1 photosystem I reaction center subunit M [Crassiphycus birdiae]YP_010196086.1 photosystem I reaction center subunit M [Gracilaria caudata]YP_010196704.1 photosystem I reaction center subunit M [Gracilaria cliftonii]YP_010196910.1 photosystem I reaction center subunit M [Crassiphycus corneus]YP_010197113
MISDGQIFVALLFALVSAVLAIRLGTDLYQ